MKLTIDTNDRTLTIDEVTQRQVLDLYSREAFELLSRQWLRVGWDLKYAYTFSWLGRPIIQLPEDLMRIQEVIYRVKPNVIVETGVAHGGSLIFYASMCKIFGSGRVVGVDIEIRPRNRKAIEEHELSHFITLIEGSSTSPEVVRQVGTHVKHGETVLVILDSCHAAQHVRQELEAYHSLVTPGSYIVATDGIMRDLPDVPHGDPSWKWDNPSTAAAEFVQAHPEFVLEQPAWSFQESELRQNITYWPDAWLRRTG